MADKRQHLAKMNAASLGDAINDDDTRELIEHQKGRSLLLVEVIHGPYTVALDGARTINLIPGTIVRVPDEHAEPIRGMLRSLAVGSGQTLTYEEPGDAFVPDPAEAAKAAKAAAEQITAEQEAASAAAADPEAPLPTGDGGDPASDPAGDDADAPWPGDDGYEAPGAPQVEDPPGTDDLAAKRAKGTRGKAAGA